MTYVQDARPIQVDLTPPEVQIDAGGQPVEVLAEVRNGGEVADQYSIEIENLDPSWYTITDKSVALFPGDSAPIPIRLHPPKNRDTRPGPYTFQVVARSQADPMSVGRTRGILTVPRNDKWKTELAPARVTGYRGKYRLKISNAGNSEVQLGFETKDAEDNLTYKFKIPEPTIQPGNTTVVPLTVGRKGLNLVGEETRYKFNVIATPADGSPQDAQQMQAELAHKPPFKTWRLPLILLGLLLLLFAWLAFGSTVTNAACSRNGVLFANWFAPGGVFYVVRQLACQGYADPPSSSRQPTDGHKFDEGTFKSGPGFIEVRDQHGDSVGQAEEDEWYENSVAHQRTANGQLMYFLKDGIARIYFVGKDGKAYTFTECNPAGQFKNCKMVELKHP